MIRSNVIMSYCVTVESLISNSSFADKKVANKRSC